jgi:hypothetical protein
MKVKELKQIVVNMLNEAKARKGKKPLKEAMTDRIKMIDEAGDQAAMEAKIMRIDEEIQQAEALKAHLSSASTLREYVSTEKVDDMLNELDTNILELQTKKEELIAIKSGKGKKPIKKKKTTVVTKKKVTPNKVK